ncbi:MAG TPA: carbohydrate ABC transporter permease [Rubrobacter sp.]|jgi:multiple sugar transport system permease protein|nr:carbohydrate ABC transporter permease [Rubrobacter sp.]HKH57655.1 carbohydrate ABC transporter permease [Rubrobacter sp.]
MSTGARFSPGKIFPYVLLLLLLLWTLVPIVWMLLSSFKSLTDVLSPTPLLTFKPTLANYIGLVSGGNNVLTYFRSSILAAGISTIIATTLGCFAGYGLARSNFRGKRHLAFWIISTRMAPIAAVILPLFIGFTFLHLINTVWGLIVAYLSFNLPFAIWIMNAFFADLPPGIEEAARVDGASNFQTFWRIALPMTAPGIVTTAILCLVFSWNDYAFAVTFAGPGSQTLPVAASQLITQTGVDWGQLTAIGTVVALPMVIVGLAVRRYLVRGLTLGAVTGE